MFNLTKKSITIVCFCVVVVTSCIGSILIWSKNSKFTYATIAIDAGHGGWDGGSVGAEGTIEANITLDLAKRLERKLKKQNFEVILTRKDNCALGDTKIEDMKERAKIIKEAEVQAVVSLHVNKYADKTRRGVQVFYDDTQIGKDFAFIMQNSINEYVNKKYSKKDKLESLPGDYYITKCVFVPSIIIECGFLSNIEDEKLLNNTKYLDDIVECITYTISSIFTTERT